MTVLSTLFVALLATGASSSDLAEVQRPPIKLEIPASWKGGEVEDSLRYSAPSGDAYFLLDVGQTARAMPGEECLGKILAGMKAKGATKLEIGGAPAAKMSAVDRSPEEKEDVHTVTYVGCDGKSTWSLVFHFVGKKKSRYTPLADKVAKSVRYLPTQSE